MTQVLTPSAPPPGWYTDPGLSGGMRWWSGVAWTEHVQQVPRPVDDAAVTVMVGAPRTFAVRALVWGVAATVLANVLAGVMAIVYGAVSLSRASTLEAQGLDANRGVAKAGLILGIVGCAGALFWVILLAVYSS